MTTKTNRRSWSLRQMFLWVLIVALAIPYLISLIPSTVNPFTIFALDCNHFVSWVVEIDPSAKLVRGGGGGHSGTNSINQDFEFTIQTANLTSEEVFLHCGKRLHEKIEAERWQITGMAQDAKKFYFYFTNKLAAYRVYGWLIPISERDAKYAETSGTNATRIKLLVVGYSHRHNNLRAQPVESLSENSNQ